MSTLNVTNISDGSNTATIEQVAKGSAKAWVNFNGTNLSIRSSYNVSSITDVDDGKYRANFSSGMGNGNYCVTACCSKDNTDDDANFTFAVGAVGNLPTSSYVPFTYTSGGLRDTSAIYIAAFAD